MKTLLIACLVVLLFITSLQAANFHVAMNGGDTNPGTQAAPFRTIQRAADLAQPGDVVTVHEGVYRERISPPRGGVSDTQRIVYQAAPGEKVAIKGSDIVKQWMKAGNDTWKVTLPNSFFRGFNPYSDVIHGDWFDPKGRTHHTGAVYLRGDWLTEAANLNEVLAPQGGNALWFGQVYKTNTIIWAQFKGADPNRQQVEINVRQTVFYPEKTGVNYITVRGFFLEDAATPWAPPTAGQIGLIGTHWSKGWIIENNHISYSICSGISLGKYGDQWDNTSADTAEGYVKTIERALAHGWSKGSIGHHIVRNNTISHCEQAGIVGSLGPAFSVVTGNTIHDIHVRRLFSGAEMAGIKFHGAIDVEIGGNRIYRTNRGLWLDWMAQGTRVSGNFFGENGEDVFVEVDHGPFLMDNNLFLSALSLVDRSQGGAYAHNLFSGAIKLLAYDSRQTPFLKPHSTEVAGYRDNPNGDDRFYNNLFLDADLRVYDHAPLPIQMAGNVYGENAQPCQWEKAPVIKWGFSPFASLEKHSDGIYVVMTYGPARTSDQGHPIREMVTSNRLGRATISAAAYEQPDGAPIQIDTDYLGRKRHAANPSPGPFEDLGPGDHKVKVWPSGEPD